MVIIGYSYQTGLQRRSQPDNLVPLCKFQIIIINLTKVLHSGAKSSGRLRSSRSLDNGKFVNS